MFPADRKAMGEACVASSLLSASLLVPARARASRAINVYGRVRAPEALEGVGVPVVGAAIAHVADPQSCHTCGTSLPALFNNGSYTVSDGTFGLILPESLSSGDPLFLCVAQHNRASRLTLFEFEVVEDAFFELQLEEGQAGVRAHCNWTHSASANLTEGPVDDFSETVMPAQPFSLFVLGFLAVAVVVIVLAKMTCNNEKRK